MHAGSCRNIPNEFFFLLFFMLQPSTLLYFTSIACDLSLWWTGNMSMLYMPNNTWSHQPMPGSWWGSLFLCEYESCFHTGYPLEGVTGSLSIPFFSPLFIVNNENKAFWILFMVTVYGWWCMRAEQFRSCSTVNLQEEGPVFLSRPKVFLHGFCMFSPVHTWVPFRYSSRLPQSKNVCCLAMAWRPDKGVHSLYPDDHWRWSLNYVF